MKQLTDAGIKGLILFQGALKPSSGVCAEVVPAGMPVLAVEIAEDPCAATLVAADELRAGQVAGAAVGAWVKAHWSCTYDAYVSLESTAVPERSQRRMEGYRQGFADRLPRHDHRTSRSVGPPIARTRPGMRSPRSSSRSRGRAGSWSSP